MIYSVYEGFYNTLEKKVKRIQNKCAALGLQSSFEIVGEEFKKVVSNDVTHTYKFYLIEASGEVKINGWTLIAKLEEGKEGNFIYSTNSAVDVPEEYRTASITCDHCNVERYRKVSYVIQNDDGRFMQIGTSCLKEYTGGLSVEMAALYYMFFEEVEKSACRTTGYDSSVAYYNTNDILHVFAEVDRIYGFVSKKHAAEFRVTSSADRGQLYYTALFNSSKFMKSTIDKALREMHEVGFNIKFEETKQLVQDVKEYFAALDSDEINTFLYNLKTAVTSEYVPVSILATLACVFKVYRTEKAKEVVKEELSTSEYMGSIGERITFDCKSFQLVYFTQTQYGMLHIYRFIDTEDNVYIWKSSTLVEQDDTKTDCKVTGTVKAHEMFGDVKQTVLTRCKIK